MTQETKLSSGSATSDLSEQWIRIDALIAEPTHRIIPVNGFCLPRRSRLETRSQALQGEGNQYNCGFYDGM